MMRDWAGLDSSEEDSAELVSVGPGDWGSGSGSSADVVMGRDDSRRLCASVDVRVPGPLLPATRLRVVYAAVLVDEFLVVCGRGVARIGDPGMLVSFRGSGESRRMDRDERVLGRPAAPGPACCICRPSAMTGPSSPGTGDGAAEPRAAAAALRIWARTWVACRSVRKATCCRRKSTVTWNRVALHGVGGRWSRGQGKGYLHLVP